jgi:DNA-binding Lrp family transcriptional regulator
VKKRGRFLGPPDDLVEMYVQDRSTYRRISERTGLSPATILRRVHDVLDELVFINHRASCGIVLLDAKALSIGGQDFCEHLVWDIQAGLIARRLWPRKESAKVYDALLTELTQTGMKITAATTDGFPGLKAVLAKHAIVHQRCHVHLLRDLRTGLQLTSRHRHKRLTPANRQKRILHEYARLFLESDPEVWDLRERHLLRQLEMNFFGLNPIQLQALRRFVRGSKYAFQHYFEDPRIPTTTNRLELYISHFSTRMRTMNGFKNALNAERILVAIHTELND